MWNAGSLLGFLGATEGAVAAVVFAWAQNRNGQQFSMILTSQENAFHFTLIIIGAFMISGIFVRLSTTSKWFSKLGGVIVLTLGLVLTILSILTAFSIGGFIFYGAVFIMLGGVLLSLASVLQPR
jgi:hypothetical protein